MMTFNPLLNNISSYEAGKPIELIVREFGIKKQDIIKLASNENPYGASKLVQEKLQQVTNTISMYPDDSYYELKDALSCKFGINSNNVIIGQGSDQIIEFCIHSKAFGTSKILIAGVTFAMYEIYAKMNGLQVIKTPSSTHNLQEFQDLYNKHKPQIVFLCLPNNPLGECLDKKDIFEYIKSCNKDTLIVIDGAYQEYASHKDKNKEISPKELINTFENTIYLGTFSKAYGLGGMRIGYGISNENTIKALHKLRPPFNITSLSLLLSIEALKDSEHIDYSIKQNFIQMQRYEELISNKNINFIKSYTNFITILLDNMNNSTQISKELLKLGIIIRDLAQYSMNAIRITIGTPKQNDIVLEKLNKLIKEAN